MAQTTLIPTRPLDSKNLNKTFKVSQKSLSNTQESVKNIGKILNTRIKTRKELYATIFETKRKRQLDTKRRDRESEIESKKSVFSGNIGGIISSANAIGGSLLDRVLKAFGFIAAGWLLRNLPTWIGYGKEFIARINELGRITKSFVRNIGGIFQGIFSTLEALKSNLMNFDLFDSERKVRNSFDDLKKSIEGLGKDFEDTINVFTTDITKEIDGVRVGSYSEEEIPEPGEGFTEDAASQTQSYSSDYSGSSSSGGGRWKPLLDLIHTVESSTDKQNNGYDAQNRAPRGVRPGLSKMTIGEIARNAPGASGRYQQMPEFLLGRARNAGYNENTVFSPEVQDALAIKLIEGRGGNEWLSGKMSTEQFMQGLSQEWAALPNASGKFAYSNQSSSLRPDKVKSVLEQVKKGPSQQDQKSSTGTPKAISTPSTTLTGGEYFKPLPRGSFKGGSRQVFGASRPGRKHLGVDITESNWAPGSDPRIPVVAVRGGTVIDEKYLAGVQYLSGLMIRQDDGYDVRYLHMEPFLKPGDKVKAGQQIGRLVDLGNQTHLHFELYKGSQLLDPTSYIKSIESGARPKTQTAVSSPPAQQAQISSAPSQQKQQALAQQITPERRGQDIAVVVPPSQQLQQQSTSASQKQEQAKAPSVGEMLNNFVKQKFLLDLGFL